ncbi:glycoside hydrolase family 61 protein-like protein [Geopyxis carbonaria]|nr:glycoside hydrolase family 61 protein-like protein [Geopyxis carbonaria]
MKFLCSLGLTVGLLANLAQSHYIFQYLTANGAKGSLFQNIRTVPNNSPVTDLASNDLRCNVNGASGSGVSTVSVKAGSTVTMDLDIAVYHQGPLSWYMAKAPSTAAAYDGSGTSWFKIKDVGPTFDSSGNAAWSLTTTYSVTIPASVPTGEYLLRVQQLAIHNPYPAGIPQFYISCAQISVTGGGSGSPKPLVAIPGAFKATDPGYVVNIYNNFKNYTVPGPAVWTG